MDIDEVINEIISDITAGAVDIEDFDALNAYLDDKGLESKEKNEILELINDVLTAEDGLDIDLDAQQMSNEDGTKVDITEVDKDGDGDTDKVTIKKQKPEDDGNSDDGNADKVTIKKQKPEDDGNSDDGNADKSDDKPHDGTVLSDARLKNIIGTISQFKY